SEGTRVGRSASSRFCCKSPLRGRANDDSVIVMRSVRGRAMMGRLNGDQGQLLYCFRLEEMVPADHLVEIAAVLDLSCVHGELAPHYSPLGRPSIDPVLMIRMLIIGYVFAIRSERARSAMSYR